MEFDQDLAARQNESSHPKPFGTNLQNGKKIMKRTNEQTNKQTNKQKKKNNQRNRALNSRTSHWLWLWSRL